MITFLEVSVLKILKILSAIAFIEAVVVFNTGDIKGALILAFAAAAGNAMSKICK